MNEGNKPDLMELIKRYEKAERNLEFVGMEEYRQMIQERIKYVKQAEDTTPFRIKYPN